LAKQLGVGDAALEGLKDPDRHPFPPDQKAALLFADAMTEGPGHVADPVFEELRRHFNEPQVVEIACVVGLFNYFNRFNNALHVEVTLMDPDILVRRVETAVAASRDAGLRERVAEMLRQGRRYSKVEFLVRIPAAGDPAREDRRRLAVPLRGAAGFIVVESDRELDDEDRALLERVAACLGSPSA